MGHSEPTARCRGIRCDPPLCPHITMLPWVPHGDAPSLRHPMAPDPPEGNLMALIFPREAPKALSPPFPGGHPKALPPSRGIPPL